MKKLNKKLALAMLSLGFAALTPSNASADNYLPRGGDPCFDPCRTDCCNNSDCGLDVGVDFLYWKPCVDDLEFAAIVTGEIDILENPLHVRYKSVCPEWEPGFRIRLCKEDAWKCFDICFNYTWLKADDSETARTDNGENIAPVGLHPFLVTANPAPSDWFDTARAKFEFNYQTFDLLFGYPFRCGSCHTITPFFGVEIAKFDQEWEAKYEFRPNTGLSTTALIDWESDFRGAGLKLGTCYNFLLCEGFSLFAKASGTIVVGEAKTTNEQSLFSVDETGAISSPNYIKFKDDDCCHFIPGWHLQLGLQYEDETCGCEYKLRFGYEMVKWCNFQNPRRWFEPVTTANIAQSIHTNTTTIGFHGLLAGFEMKF